MLLVSKLVTNGNKELKKSSEQVMLNVQSLMRLIYTQVDAI